MLEGLGYSHSRRADHVRRMGFRHGNIPGNHIFPDSDTDSLRLFSSLGFRRMDQTQPSFAPRGVYGGAHHHLLLRNIWLVLDDCII
jgi:hypothetical protein